MSYPTILSPWFVVQRLKSDGTISGDYVGMEYYTSVEEGGPTFQEGRRGGKKVALIFMSLHSATRVAASEGAEVRVLSSKAEMEEFGR